MHKVFLRLSGQVNGKPFMAGMYRKSLHQGLNTSNRQRHVCTTTLLILRIGSFKAPLHSLHPSRHATATKASSSSFSSVSGSVDSNEPGYNNNEEQEPGQQGVFTRLQEWISGSPWDWRKLLAVTAAAAAEIFVTGRWQEHALPCMSSQNQGRLQMLC